jgi:chemotaxis protein methyltransferase CheR
MTADAFQLVASLVHQRCGLVLTPDKAYLVESRLTRVARRRNLNSLDELLRALRCRRDEQLIRDVVEAMTTNESSFFREKRSFDAFREVILPHWIASHRSRRSVRIWCAACSSGQEPYSLAILLREESSRLGGLGFEILATDVNSQMLQRARAGRYSELEMRRGMPADLLSRYFAKTGEGWEIAAEIRSMVRFREHNLLDDLRSLGSFEVVFCRNVLIYFDQPTKQKVIQAITALLVADGVLFLGGAETLVGIDHSLQPLSGLRGCYARNGNAGSRPSVGARMLAGG